MQNIEVNVNEIKGICKKHGIILRLNRTAYTVLTKGYYDLKWFNLINQKKAFFVTRLKDNADIIIAGQ